MSLTPHGRRDAEIDLALHESNVRHVVKLVGAYGLSARDRSNLADELHRRTVTAPDARTRGVADVWRERLAAGEEISAGR